MAGLLRLLPGAVPGATQPAREQRSSSIGVRCKAQRDGTAGSRRKLLSQLGLGLAAVGIAELPAGEAGALPGFKKEMTNKRRIKVPESEYKVGEGGVKYYDVTPGKGAEAKLGERVVVHFEAKWKGVTFQTSRQGMGVTGGNPLGFDVGASPGAGGTLKGLDLGVRGMHVGGRRKLIVPPELAYGNKGFGEVPPGASLDFDVELLSIKSSGFKKKG